MTMFVKSLFLLEDSWKRLDNVSEAVALINAKMIPKVHDRLATLEHKVKKFEPMLKKWENGNLVKIIVKEKTVKVPAKDAKKPEKSAHRVAVDYETYQKVMQMTADGLGIRRISKAVGFSQPTISSIRRMSPERVEYLRQLHEQGKPVRAGGEAMPLDGRTLRDIAEIYTQTPDIPLARLSAMTGVSVYYVKKYLALSDEERAALLEDVDPAYTSGVFDAPETSEINVHRHRRRRSHRKGTANDVLLMGDDDD